MSALVNIENHADVVSYVEHVLKLHPEWVELARKKKFEELQRELELHFSKFNRVNYTMECLFKETELTTLIRNELIAQDAVGVFEEDDIHYALTHLYLHRRLGKEALAGLIKHRFNNPVDLEQFCEFLEDLNFVDVSGDVYISCPFVNLTIAQQQALDLFQSNIPMICKPKKVKVTPEFQKNGYITIIQSVWSKKADPHAEYVPTDFLDMQNAIKYKINYHVWEAIYQDSPQLSHPERGLNSKGEPKTDDEWQEAKDAADRHHWRKDFILTLFRFLDIQYIYVLNMFDYRLRNYPVAYLFNPQGTDADKCLFALEPEEINASGVYWLSISIANCFNCEYEGLDLDKHIYPIRFEWFKENMLPLLEEKSLDVFKAKLKQLALKADAKGCFYAQMHNYWHILHRGAKVWCICHFDATASGYQMQSIFAGDFDMATLVNLIDPESRIDLYTVIWERVEPILKKAGFKFKHKLKRNDFKKYCLIPAVYNSVKSIKEMLTRALGLPMPNFENGETWDEQVIEGFELINQIMSQYKMWTLNRSFPDYWDSATTRYHFYAPDGAKIFKIKKVQDEYSIYIKGQEYTLKEMKEGPVEYSLELGPNLTHAFDGFVARDIARRMKLSKKKKFIKLLLKRKDLWTRTEDSKGSRKIMGHLANISRQMEYRSARILTELNQHNIDMVSQEIIEELLNEIPDCYASVSEIHDSFGVLPNYAEELMRQYRFILARLCDSRYLAHVIECLQGMEGAEHGVVYVAKPSEAFKQAILDSKYALC